MDSIDNAYYSMFQNQKTEAQNINIIDEIINQLNNHLRFFINILSIQQQKLFKFILVENLPVEIICTDNVRFKFQLKFGNQYFNFFCIPNELIKYLARKRIPILQFYGGEISDPNKEKIFNIFKSLPLKTTFIKKRIKQLKNLEKLSQNQIKPKQETIDIVWLQYCGYFRKY